ncbi:hypothetical protein Ae717Ps2_4953 [Pseudonocardia sp. Ae717_Ps2]|nr:hypothetical protein Ae717Ps2_4953 [Pseudonocardia sp. Ae717_Ps2]
MATGQRPAACGTVGGSPAPVHQERSHQGLFQRRTEPESAVAIWVRELPSISAQIMIGPGVLIEGQDRSRRRCTTTTLPTTADTTTMMITRFRTSFVRVVRTTQAVTHTTRSAVRFGSRGASGIGAPFGDADTAGTPADRSCQRTPAASTAKNVPSRSRGSVTMIPAGRRALNGLFSTRPALDPYCGEQSSALASTPPATVGVVAMTMPARSCGRFSSSMSAFVAAGPTPGVLPRCVANGMKASTRPPRAGPARTTHDSTSRAAGSRIRAFPLFGPGAGGRDRTDDLPLTSWSRR